MPYYLQDDIERGAVGVGVEPNAQKASNAQPNGDLRLLGARQGDTHEWVDPDDVGTTTFEGLTDTPADYSGLAGMIPVVNAGETALEFGGRGFAYVGDTVPADLAPYANELVAINHEIFKVVPHQHSAHNAQMQFRDPVSADIAAGITYRGTFSDYLHISFVPAEDDVIYTRDQGRLYKRVGAYWRLLDVPRFITNPPVADQDHAEIAVVASTLTPKNGLLVAWTGSDLRAVSNYVAPTTASVTYDLTKVAFTSDEIQHLIDSYGHKTLHGTTAPAGNIGVNGDLYLRHVTTNNVVSRVDAYFKVSDAWQLVFSWPVGSTASGIDASTAQLIARGAIEAAVTGNDEQGINVVWRAHDNTLDFGLTRPLPENPTLDQDGYRVVWQNGLDRYALREDQVKYYGSLPPASLDNYDSSNARPLFVAFQAVDGEWYKPGRVEHPDARAAGTWTNAVEGTTTFSHTDPGTGTLDYTLRYRGVHWQDYLVPNPVEGDIYFNRHNTGTWRHYNALNRWEDLSQTRITNLNYIGFFPAGESDARAHITAAGQRAVWIDQNNSSGVFATMGNDWMAAAQYTPTWLPLEHVQFVPVSGTGDSAYADLDRLLPQDTNMEIEAFGLSGAGDGEGWDDFGGNQRGGLDPPLPAGSDLVLVYRLTDDFATTSLRGRILIAVEEDSNTRSYDGAKIRWKHTADDNDAVYTLEYHNRTESQNLTRYRTTSSVSYDPTPGFHAQFNIEDVHYTNPFAEVIPGAISWLWYDHTHDADPNVDASVASLRGELNEINGVQNLSITAVMTDTDTNTMQPRMVTTPPISLAALGSGMAFTPSKSNLYDAVKAILHPTTNAAVTADDANNELDIATGTANINAFSPLNYNSTSGALTISGIDGDIMLDSSIPPSKLEGNTSRTPDPETKFYRGDGSWHAISGGGTFTPSQANLYSAVKAILHPDTQGTVTADDANNELDISGATGAVGRGLAAIFRRSATAPATPTGGAWNGSTFTVPANWATNPPSGTDTLYVVFATLLSPNGVTYSDPVSLGGGGSTVDLSGYAQLTGAAFTGAITIAESTANSALAITQTGNEEALTISQSQAQHSLNITQTGNERAIMVNQMTNQAALEIRSINNTNEPTFKLITPSTGDRKAFQATNNGQNLAWASFEFQIGGTGKPGFALGPGTGARDVNLYREGANILRTDDAFTVGDFTTTQRNALTGVDAGTIIWNTTTTQFERYNGTAWGALAGTGSGSFTSLAAGSKGTIDVTNDGSGNFTIDVGTDEITATELGANAVGTIHMAFAAGTTETAGHAITIGSTAGTVGAAEIPSYSAATTSTDGLMSSADKTIIDGLANTYAALAGATFTGNISLPAATAAAHAVRKSYVDGGFASLSGASFTGNVLGIAPTADAHLTRKDYVDENSTKVNVYAAEADLPAIASRTAGQLYAWRN